MQQVSVTIEKWEKILNIRKILSPIIYLLETQFGLFEKNKDVDVVHEFLDTGFMTIYYHMNAETTEIHTK